MLLTDLMLLLPVSWRPYAKAITPAGAAVLAAIIGWFTGAGDLAALEVAVVGLLAASITFVVTNGPAGLRRYAKALAPAALTILAVVVHGLLTGEWDAAEWRLAVTGLAAAVISLLIPNAGPLASGAGTLATVGHVPAEHPPLATGGAVSGGGLHSVGEDPPGVGRSPAPVEDEPYDPPPAA